MLQRASEDLSHAKMLAVVRRCASEVSHRDGCWLLLFAGSASWVQFREILDPGRQEFQCDVLGDFVQWRISAQVSGHQIEIDLQCWREEMLLMNYRTPMDFTVTLNCGMAGQLVG